jgi:hyperosmotically inducible protein
MRTLLCACFAPVLLVAADKPAERLTKEVRHELAMLPYYSVFDNLAYRVDGSKVTLFGQVTKPTLKTDAERAVKRIEGIDRVDNQIEVLPLSPNDERIRWAVLRAIRAKLPRYEMQVLSGIHIIVKNGNVTLVGVVDNEGDKNLAVITVKTVSGVFDVKDELVVEK